MAKFPKKLAQKLQDRSDKNTLRKLPATQRLVDFSSNDYLGLTNEISIEKATSEILKLSHHKNGATGSRLLSGNHLLHEKLENFLATFYNQEGALLFNSGYDANVGFFSCVPQRGDIILYDELMHASIRDGIKLSNAKAYKFKHNDVFDLNTQIGRIYDKGFQEEIYVVTESVFSMDGDSPDLKVMAALCTKKNVHLIVDEAHAVGVFEKGLLNFLGIENQVFAQIVTFGKAMGYHGAAVLGTIELKNYLINFARSFVYTTAMPPHSAMTILAAYRYLASKKGKNKVRKLHSNITYFKRLIKEFRLEKLVLPSDSAIQIVTVIGNDRAKQLSQNLIKNGFDVRPILSPTVAEGNERLRICLHAFNTEGEIHKLLSILKETHGQGLSNLRQL
ncbi:aminotransferase class I/II-fold pyridoxal phosphate-dependent enzyme [Croceitalea rosinachiae]|uniref:Aminotransferase class I/II-fold pyridoxal phosphate-dependent enzyme n=1 Tax=Croceitalea rosinachiae TaxID=3075596 RepID=A0ABU3A8Q6_9FLAO|nr:aminotransferase class I/II-fold pyridoxal phosphate-dependent enzyme [Croceitalea sp. F388]MDT0606566.1 aminotransferase class I/II-fold pyridoxal phosphate-dependent enzyme [Croceitalea sp. F388]